MKTHAELRKVAALACQAAERAVGEDIAITVIVTGVADIPGHRGAVGVASNLRDDAALRTIVQLADQIRDRLPT